MNSAEQSYINRQEHLSEKQLMRYERGQMEGAEMQRVEQHLLNCELCSDALEGLALLPALEAEEAVQEIRGRLSERISGAQASSPTVYWRWGIAASILLLFTSGLFLLFQDGAPGDQLLVQSEEINPGQPELPVPSAGEAVSFTDTEENTIEAETAEDPALSEVKQPGKPEPSFRKAEPAASQPASSIADSEAKPLPEALESTSEPAEETLTEDLNLDWEVEESLTESITFEVVPDEEEPAVVETAPLDSPAGSQAALAIQRAENKGLRSSMTESGQSRQLSPIALPLKKVRGKVTDADGKPLPGVHIRLKGSNTGTLTDEKGEYALHIPAADTSLLLQFVGYLPREVPLEDTTRFVASELQEEVLALEEVVLQENVSARKAETENSPTKPVSGWNAFEAYLQEKQVYPAAAKEAGVEGTIALTFTVLPDGSLEDFRLLNSLGYGLDEEAIRLVKKGPAWQPAVAGKEAVTQKVSVKIHFTLK